MLVGVLIPKQFDSLWGQTDSFNTNCFMCFFFFKSFDETVTSIYNYPKVKEWNCLNWKLFLPGIKAINNLSLCFWEHWLLEELIHWINKDKDRINERNRNMFLAFLKISILHWINQKPVLIWILHCIKLQHISQFCIYLKIVSKFTTGIMSCDWEYAILALFFKALVPRELADSFE